MKKFLRILAYIKPYWVYALLNVLSNMHGDRLLTVLLRDAYPFPEPAFRDGRTGSGETGLRSVPSESSII